MSSNRLSVGIFVGLVGATALASSGKFFDANGFLDKFRPITEQTSIVVDEDVAASEEKVPTLEVVEAEAPQPTEKIEPPKEVVVDAEQPEAEIAPEPAIQAEIIAPTFDVLRVEPSGNMVIAGVASPKAILELVAGAKILTQTHANDRGEFVAVLDEALAPGDYEIVLRATSPDGAVVTSTETAIVSIPETGGSDVIALVEAPGLPSRLITLPSTETALLPVDPKVQTEEQADPTVVVPEAKLVLDPQLELQIDQDAPVEEADSAEEELAELASTPAASQEPAEAKQEAPAQPIRIEAVEIDGPTVFVAGAAAAGTKLRVYANEILLGDVVANQEGRFLIDANRELPVGDYIIRADALGANGAEVIMRAAVPFTRQEGVKIAAVAVPPAPELPPEAPIITNEVAEELEEPAVEPNVADPAVSAQGELEKPQLAKDENGEAPSAMSAQTDNSEGNTAIEAANLEERLTPVSNSVVIRRGDTLWQISRRVYGRGIKYTTIYKANQEQITNPDRIWPGQVFELPDDAPSQSN